MSSMKIVFATVVSIGLGGTAAFVAMNDKADCTSCHVQVEETAANEKSSCCSEEKAASAKVATQVSTKVAANSGSDSCCGSEAETPLVVMPAEESSCCSSETDKQVATTAKPAPAKTAPAVAATKADK